MMSHGGRAARREPRAPAIPAGTELAPELSDPRRDGAMVLWRAPMLLGDAGPAISVLVSIAAQSEDLLFDAVADARDQGYTWREIAARLACSVRTAHRRFSGYAHQRGNLGSHD
jgi:AraC-like DNA-binding protein